MSGSIDFHGVCGRDSGMVVGCAEEAVKFDHLAESRHRGFEGIDTAAGETLHWNEPLGGIVVLTSVLISQGILTGPGRPHADHHLRGR